jgi:autotransporter-associated beta strand protein
MKPNYRACPFAKVIYITFTLAAQSVDAASSSWNTNANGNWSNVGSPPWSAGSPGATTGTTSTDIATFGTSLTTNRIVTVDSDRNIGGITFSNTSNFGYTLTGGNILLTNGGVIQTTNANGSHTDIISSAIQIQGDGGTASFLTNTTTNTRLLSIADVTGVSTVGNTTALTLGGTVTGLNLMTGTIGDGSAGGKLSVTKSGTGTWRLQGNNTYTGGTAIYGGTLSLNSAGALGSTGTISFGGGTLQFSANNTTDYSARFSTAASQAFRFDTNGQTVALGTALVSTGGSLTKSGTGALTLNAANTYDGGTTVAAGSLVLASGATLATTGNITISGNGAVLDLGGTTQTISGAINLTRGTLLNGKIINNSANYTTTNADPMVVSAVLDGSAGYTKTGTAANSTVTLSGNNTYSGGTLLSGNLTGGSIRIGHVKALGSGMLTFDGGVLGLSAGLGDVTNAMAATTNTAYRFDTLSFSATVTADLGANGTNELTKASTGTLTLSGNNTYTGGTRINAGSLSLGSANALGATGVISFGGGTLQYTSSNTTDYSARFSTAASQAFRIDTNSQNVTLATGLSSTGGSLAKSGTGTLTLTGSNSYDSGTSVSAGTILLSGGSDRLSTTGNISIGTGADADGINLGGTTQNTSGSVTVGRGSLSNGTINIMGAGSYLLTAKANVSANLQGTASTSLTVNNGANTASLSGNNTFGGGITITGASTSVLNIGSSAALGTGTLTFDGGTLGSPGSLGSLTITNAITATGSNNYRFNPGSGTTFEITSNLAGPSNGVSKSEAGSVILNGNKSYGGITTISRGILSVTSLANGGSPSSIGNSSNAASNLLIGGSSSSNPSTLQYVGTSAASTDRLFTAVQGPSGSSLANSAADPAHTLTFSNTGSIVMSGTGTRTIGLGGTNTGDNTFALQIDNEGANATSFTKREAGKWILTGANTYTGVTNIAAGTLLVNGTHIYNTGTSGYSVTGTNSTLGGTGRLAITGNVSVATGAVVAPGASIGALTLDGANRTGAVLSMTTGSEFAFELAGDGYSADQLVFWNYLAGDLVLNSNAIDLDLLGSLTAGTYNLDIFRFFSNSGTTATTHAFTTGLSIGTWNSNISNAFIDWDGSGNNNEAIALTFTVVPEPNVAMLIGGLGMLTLLRRRRD